MLWRGLTLLKTTHNHRHGSQGASQGNQQSDGHGGSCGAGDLRLAPIHRYHHCIILTTGRFNGPIRRRWIGVVEGGTMRGLRRRNALFFTV